ncbi:MAG: hypothetical protein KME32_05255 [Mojavia pulchra JT2-VF2]|jgi:hypothetical protein|uniref:Uncharacterized protein n=1 Tax=Mojavia pulchra JT2-VF2 TaxID=287848 RepID=A0A951PX75_9NOST|nr:hypothetical protein [Mojavia pulchra JT2-VF2]
MSKARWLPILHSWHIQVVLWALTLLLLGISFWVGGELLTKHLLSHSYGTLDKLQADTQLPIQLKLNVTVIAIEINKGEDFTQVEVKTANSVIKYLEFELPNQPSNALETAIAWSAAPAVGCPKGCRAIAKKLELTSKLVKLKGNAQLVLQLPINLQAIKAEIDREQGFSNVEVITANDLLTKFEIALPVVKVNMVEAMIAQELGITHENVRSLVRYQIRSPS